MLKRIAFVGISLLITLSFAQAPDTLWTRTYGATDIGEQGYSIHQTIEGGYIIVGLRYSLSSDVYVVCTNQLGYALWERVYGDPTVSDEAHDVQQTFDLGFIIVGSTVSSGREKVYLIKVSPFGVFMWHRTYGGNSCYCRGYSIQQTTEGGYIITGNTRAYPVGDHDVLLIKTDSLGDTLWTRTYGGGYDDFARSVQQTPDQGFIIAGFTNSFGQGAPTCFNFYLIKTDSLGDTLWTRAYGGGDDEKATTVRCTSDNGYVIVGTGGSGCYVVKTDTSGDTIWTKTYNYGGVSIEGTADGGYIIGGNCQGFYLLKINDNGDSLWARSYPTEGQDDHCNMACATSDGGYVMAGNTFLPSQGVPDVLLIKTAPDPGIEEETIIRHGKGQKTFGPTIFNGPLLLPEGKNCRVFDITGRVVMPERVKPGIYFIEVEGKIKQKVIKIR